jgi:hypothetical protein
MPSHVFHSLYQLMRSSERAVASTRAAIEPLVVGAGEYL